MYIGDLEYKSNSKKFLKLKKWNERKLAKIELNNIKLEMKNEQISKSKLGKPKIQTTKLILIFILVNCTIVELYSMFVMLYLQDLSALYSLITSVITESISFAIYCCKAYNENKQIDLNKLEREKYGLENIQHEDTQG